MADELTHYKKGLKKLFTENVAWPDTYVRAPWYRFADDFNPTKCSNQNNDPTERMRRCSCRMICAPVYRAALCAFLCLLMCGCVSLIGDYDPVIDNGVTDLQQKVETYVSKLQSAPDTPYDASFYQDIFVRLAVLKTRAEASDKKEILCKQLNELKATLVDFQKVDQGVARKNGKINTLFVTSAQSAVEVEVESILKLELALKRGNDSASTTQ